MKEITWEKAISVWWSIKWRILVFGFGVWFFLSILYNAGLLNNKDIAWLGLLSGIAIDIVATKLGIQTHYGDIKKNKKWR